MAEGASQQQGQDHQQQQAPGGPPLPLFPSPLVLVACVAAPDTLPPPMRRCFTHELAVDAPAQPARRALLEACLRGSSWGQAGGSTDCRDGSSGSRNNSSGTNGSGDGREEGGVVVGGEVLEELARHTAGLLPREVSQPLVISNRVREIV